MKSTVLTFQLVFAAGRDAGNRSMRAAGRKKWIQADYNAACREFRRLNKILKTEERGSK